MFNALLLAVANLLKRIVLHDKRWSTFYKHYNTRLSKYKILMGIG